MASTGTLLTERGARSRLALTAFNAEGRVVPAGAVTWKSSDPATITVDADGGLTAIASGGSADITAVGASGASAVATVVVAAAGPRTRVLAPDAVRTAPAAVLGADGQPTGQFLLTLNPAPSGLTEGDLLVGDSPAVLGRVVALRPGGEVLMELVDPGVAFPGMNVRSEGSFTNAQFVLAEDLSPLLEVAANTAQGISYRRRAMARQPAVAPSARRQALAPGDAVKCEGASAAEIKLEPQKIRIDVSRARWKRAWQPGVEQAVIVQGPITLSLSFKVAAHIAAGLTRKCSLLLGYLPLPVGAPTWVLGAKVPVKIGFEVGAEAKLLELTYELTQTETIDFELGFRCLGSAACGWVTSATSQRDQSGTTPPAPTRQDGRLGYKFNVFATVGIEMAPPLIGSDWLKFTLVQAKTKLEFASETGPELDQVVDPAWSAKYQWSAVAAFKTFLAIDDSAKAGLFLTKFITLPDPLASELEFTLASWGPAKLSSMTSTGAFVVGQTRTIRVSLNPESLAMPLGGSPLTGLALHLRRQDGSFDAVPVQFASAAPNQTEFDLEVLVTPDMINGRFIAFAQVAPSYLTLGHDIELGSLAIAPAQANVEASAQPPASVPNEKVTLHADVSVPGSTQAPTGVVDFVDLSRNATLCSATVVAKAADTAAATCETRFSAMGTYQVIARYTGTGAFSSFQGIVAKPISILVDECVLSPAVPVLGSSASLTCYADAERTLKSREELYQPGFAGGGQIVMDIYDSGSHLRIRHASFSLDGNYLRKFRYDWNGDVLVVQSEGFVQPGLQTAGTTPYVIGLYRTDYAGDGSWVSVGRGCGSTPAQSPPYNIKFTDVYRPGAQVETTSEVIDVAQCPTPADVNGLFPLEIGDSRLYRLLK